MNKISSPRTRKHKTKDEMKQEIVAQVHKTIPKSDTSSERTNLSFSDDNIESNKTYKLEDKNDNYNNTHTPSREISVDGESQINSKILSLIETEMKRDINKHSHFTDSRPQSLSFYEDEKIPEELSGNLELLSPEERKHYKKRKEYERMDTEERNAYNVIQDLYSSRDNGEIIGSSSKKSKSRKKRHGDSEMGIGDSREMMIPKEKRRSKKKKRESTSPMNSSNSKRKHRKKDEYEPKSEISVALEELQDDVFENANEEREHVKPDRISRSPRQSDKVYVQKKNKFEATTRPNAHLNRQTAYDFEEDNRKEFFEMYPLQLAIPVQKFWARLSTLCHGLLGGLAIGQWVYVISNYNSQDGHFLYNYSHYSQIYVLLFYVLCIVCIISVLDRFDLAHLGAEAVTELLLCKKCSLVMLLYIACLAVHLTTLTLDEQITEMNIGVYNATICNMTSSDLSKWNYLTATRSLLALLSWTFVGLFSEENRFYTHLKNMEKFLPTDR